MGRTHHSPVQQKQQPSQYVLNSRSTSDCAFSTVLASLENKHKLCHGIRSPVSRHLPSLPSKTAISIVKLIDKSQGNVSLAPLPALGNVASRPSPSHSEKPYPSTLPTLRIREAPHRSTISKNRITPELGNVRQPEGIPGALGNNCHLAMVYQFYFSRHLILQ